MNYSRKSGDEMKVLVIGSEGTIGKPLVKALRVYHDVYTADLQHHGDPKYSRCNIENYRQCDELIRSVRPEMVYLLAAEFGRINGEEYYESVWKTNVIGTRNILELQTLYRFKLIFTSSSEIYGEPEGVEWLTEDIPLSMPLRQNNDYAITKWVNEQQIMNFEDRFQTEIMRIRLFNAYGPGEEYTRYRSVVCLFCHCALNGIPYTVFEGYHRVFMHINDLIPTLFNCIEKFSPGEVFNVGGKEYRSVVELNDAITGCLTDKERGRQTFHLESLDHHNVVSKRPDISKAMQRLGHDPKITLDVGIPETVEWHRK
jgi:dTDP-glucose 4,6-dehydratase